MAKWGIVQLVYALLSVGSYGTRNIVVIGMIVLERPTESCIDLFLSKFYSSGDPPFKEGFRQPCLYGRSMSRFPTNELFPVPTDHGAISRPMWCLQSNTLQPPSKIDLTTTKHYLTTFLWFSGLEITGMMPAKLGMIYTRLTMPFRPLLVPKLNKPTMPPCRLTVQQYLYGNHLWAWLVNE
jgi:hypothetical protein